MLQLHLRTLALEGFMFFLPREEEQGLIEYTLMLILVAVVVIIVLALIGPAIGNIFTQIQLSQ